jgi:hypothetical protein
MTQALTRGHGPKVARFVLALLSGTPYVGGVFSGAAGAWFRIRASIYLDDAGLITQEGPNDGFT